MHINSCKTTHVRTMIRYPCAADRAALEKRMHPFPRSALGNVIEKLADKAPKRDAKWTPELGPQLGSSHWMEGVGITAKFA